MRAIVWQGRSEMTVEERPDPPDPGPDELILQPELDDEPSPFAPPAEGPPPPEFKVFLAGEGRET